MQCAKAVNLKERVTAALMRRFYWPVINSFREMRLSSSRSKSTNSNRVDVKKGKHFTFIAVDTDDI